jgi:hypothetical protein
MVVVLMVGLQLVVLMVVQCMVVVRMVVTVRRHLVLFMVLAQVLLVVV